MKRTLARCALALSAFVAWPSLANAPGDVRVALVIGNASYPGSAALPNPANDARAVAQALKDLGFEVTEVVDASKSNMADAIAKASASLKGKQGVGLFYYAGHGLQLDWRNYMVPVDAKLTGEKDVPQQAVDVNEVLRAFKESGSRMNIVVLDACRDNPFKGASSGKGLAQMDAPTGTFLAYATAPGNVAEDGNSGSNSPYTRYLLEELKKPQARIEDVFKRVRFHVRQQSQGRQIPWESTSLEDDFYFNSGVQPAKVLEGRARDQAFAAEKADWDKIKDSKDANDFYAYLQKYPNGLISQQAQGKLEILAAAKIQTQADQNGVQQPATRGRFTNGATFDFVEKDGLTGVEKRRGTFIQSFVGDDLVERRFVGDRSGTLLTSAGFVLRSYGNTFDPPHQSVPADDFQVGKKWAGRSIVTRRNGTKEWVDVDGRIEARESLTIPMGTFDSFRMTFNYVFQSGYRSTEVLWVDPKRPDFPLKRVLTRRVLHAAPDIEIRELTGRSPLPSGSG